MKEEVVVTDKYLYMGNGDGGKILNETIKSKRTIAIPSDQRPPSKSTCHHKKSKGHKSSLRPLIHMPLCQAFATINYCQDCSFAMDFL